MELLAFFRNQDLTGSKIKDKNFVPSLEQTQAGFSLEVHSKDKLFSLPIMSISVVT
jgi:hypothetical protein